MNILITGANGQLGNELKQILAAGKSEIGTISTQYHDCDIVSVDVDTLDIACGESVQAFLAEKHPDIVINCAAMTNVDGCEEALDTAMKVNAVGARNLAAACESVGAKLVHVSTDYVFRGNEAAPRCEWDACMPNTVYGKSKLLGEQYVAQFCSRYFIVRTAWLYGLVGNNFVKTMLRLGREKEELKVVDDQRGNPTNANDLAHHILKLALTEEYGVYHCTGAGECSWYDFTCRIMEYAGLSCKVNPCTTAEFPRPAPRPAFSSLRNLMLECTVGDEMRPWEDALMSYIKQVKE